MKKAILATKVGMTQIFNADGVLVPVTVLTGWSVRTLHRSKLLITMDTALYRLVSLTKKRKLSTKMPMVKKKSETDMV